MELKRGKQPEGSVPPWRIYFAVALRPTSSSSRNRSGHHHPSAKLFGQPPSSVARHACVLQHHPTTTQPQSDLGFHAHSTINPHTPLLLLHMPLLNHFQPRTNV
uniref:Uncharacterized protein n=1 Tax=Cucumis melo TaxID=3656 RepID=A0A9I9EL05_CUCME